MSMRTIGVAALSLALLSTGAFGAEEAESSSYFKKGDVLLEFSGSYNHAGVSYHDDDDSRSASLDLVFAQVGGSYFFTDSISAGADSFWIYVPSVDIGDGDEDMDAMAIGPEFNVRYHWRLGKSLYPYVGVHAGYAWGRVSMGDGSESDHLSTVGAHVGVDIPINDHVFFDVQLKYTDYNLPVSGLELDTFRVLLGLKIKL